MPHYTVFSSLFVTDEVDADSADAARAQVGAKFSAAGVDFMVDDVILSDEEEGRENE